MGLLDLGEEITKPRIAGERSEDRQHPREEADRAGELLILAPLEDGVDCDRRLTAQPAQQDLPGSEEQDLQGDFVAPGEDGEIGGEFGVKLDGAAVRKGFPLASP
ncbi:MAG TPA: hypothetical protein VOA87_03125, partial [Thermoanaerobaculia bacterium]|nr:hypothetical protein [Thermoanaerobaculia bacterium]